MTDEDRRHLRRALELAREAKARGDGPFGALLVDDRGEVLAEAGNTCATANDRTAHAEMNLLRAATGRFPAAVLARCTLYCSAEPCGMCAGAVFWSGVGRVVFGMGVPRQIDRTADPARRLGIRCAEVLATAGRPVAVVGPALEDEAAAVFDDAAN